MTKPPSAPDAIAGEPDGSPLHAGERAVQARAGVREAVEPLARRLVRSELPDAHRALLARVPFVVAAARDAGGRPWATVIAGGAGFAHAPDPRRIVLRAGLARGDALEGALAPGRDLGLLAIDLESRRRRRANGRVVKVDAGGIVLDVVQAFGNCPRYIHPRGWRRVRAASAPPRRARRLSPAMRERIRAADTFFIASGHRGAGESPAWGMDASHRGGPPGFVAVDGDARLVFPDYAGNDLFNTLGNLALDPRAGLLFVDFERGDLLQLTGRATVEWDVPASARDAGARRLVGVDVEETVEIDGALPLRWHDAGDD